MRSTFLQRKKGGRRTSRGRSRLSAEEQRRLFQLGISLAVFVLALLGRNAFPKQAESWSDLLRRDIDLGAALSRFEESTAQGEPFLDALGELCIEVLTTDAQRDIKSDQPGTLSEEKPDPAERFRIWNEFRESQWHSD